MSTWALRTIHYSFDLYQVSENDYTESPLLADSLMGHTERVKRLLDRGAKVSQQDGRGLSPLILASIRGYTDTVRLLLARGAKVDLQASNGMSALSAAGYCGRTETFKLLLDHGSLHGNHALLVASFSGHTDIVKLLIAHGTPINGELSALNLASLGGRVETVKWLLDQGAEVNAQDEDGESPIVSASITGSSRAVKYLISKIQVDFRNYGASTFIRSSVEGHDEVIKLLLDHGAQVNMQGGNGVFPLIGACFSGNTETVRLLLHRGAEAKTQHSYALFMASLLGHADIANLLLDHGAEVNAKNENISLLNIACLTAGKLQKFVSEFEHLPMASIEEHAKTIELLVRRGAQVNEQDDNGYFPLLLASATGCTETVKLLLAHGAEVNMESSDGISALSVATAASLYFPCGNNEYQEISTLLLHHGAGAKHHRLSIQTVSSAIDIDVGHHDPKQCGASSQALTSTADTSAFTHQSSDEMDEEAEDEKLCSRSYLDSKFQKKIVSMVNSFAANITNFVMPPGNPQVHTQQMSQQSKETLKMANLFREMLPLASEWLSIGTLLDLPDGELDVIKANSSQVRDCLREMLKAWLNTVDPPPSWERLAKEVKEINAKKAEEIRKSYCS